jgi:hypothetical protein
MFYENVRNKINMIAWSRESDPCGPAGDGRVKIRQDSIECQHEALGL